MKRSYSIMLATLLIPGFLMPSQANQIDIVGPAGSGAFGTDVVVLSNGNIVVTDPLFDHASVTDVGAVYLYNTNLDLISRLTGSAPFDRVGHGDLTVLATGHVVISSPFWNENRGAVTWIHGATGVNQEVSADNSLVGGSVNDFVGLDGVTALANGNFVVTSTFWRKVDVNAFLAGAVTWGDGRSGLNGVVSAENSLIGSAHLDALGVGGIVALSNGNYLVSSTLWDNVNNNAADAGAVTWGDGATGVHGEISTANSLLGSAANDNVGATQITELLSGNYVVSSASWHNGDLVAAGAVTWGNGMTGVRGQVSIDNSLVGSAAGQAIGNGGVIALANGHYVVRSPFWDNGAVPLAGATTWGDGAKGVTGEISASNSLVGSSERDFIGSHRVTALSNGHYVVRSPFWDNGSIANAGAATWGDGAFGSSGEISAENSLVGSSTDDFVGDGGVVALRNGNYVVRSTEWDHLDLADVGAATWGDGAIGVSGEVSIFNSLIGNSPIGFVDEGGITALANGHYVVANPDWGNGEMANIGAVTWGDGTIGVTGLVSADNSLIGLSSGDLVGNGGVTALSNGHYVVGSPFWQNGNVLRAGAASWQDGWTRTAGTISAANSLVGVSIGDFVSLGGVTGFNNGNFVVSSTQWANNNTVRAGAATWGDGVLGLSGEVSPENSLVGGSFNDTVGSGGIVAMGQHHYLLRSPRWDDLGLANVRAVTLVRSTGLAAGLISLDNSVVGESADNTIAFPIAFDNNRGRLVVGRSADNAVTLLVLIPGVLFKNGFEQNPISAALHADPFE